MWNRCAAVVRVCLVLVSLGILTPESIQAQEIRDRKTLEAESAKASRLTKEGNYLEALPIAQRVVDAAEKLYGPNATNTATYLNILGSLYSDLGEYAKAEPILQRGLKIREDKLGKNHLDVGRSLNNLGGVYRSMGQYARAEPLLQRSLQIKEAAHGKDHPDVALGLNNLAGVYRSMGQFAKAESLYQRGLKIREDKLSKDHLDVAWSLNSLGLLYWDLGQYAKAEPLYQRCLMIRENKLSKDHPLIGVSLNNLTLLYMDLGQYAKAEPLYRRSLKIKEDKLGKDHPDVAVSLNNLALLYENLGQYGMAEPLYLRSLKIREDSLGKDHPDVARSLNNLAALYKDLGQYTKAEPLFRRSLKIREDKLGKDHPDVARSLINLALLYEASDRTGSAAEQMDRARRTARRHTIQVLPVLSESEQLAFLRQKDELHGYEALSLGLHHADNDQLAQQSASWLLNGKGVAQQTLVETTLLTRDSRDPSIRDLSQRLQQTRQELARLTLTASSVEPIQQRLNDLSEREQILAKQLRRAGSGVKGESWIELSQLRAALPPDGILINLARFDVFDFKATRQQKYWQPAHYAAWIISAKGPVRVIDLGPADAIDAEVQKIRQAFQDATKTIRLQGEANAETTVREALEALAKKVLHPLLPHIGKAQHWIISPDGNLWLTPWAALPLPDGKYAVESHTLAYVISGRDLVDQTPVKVTTTAPLVLADPDFDLRLDKAALETRRLLRGQEIPDDTRGISKALRLGNVKRLPGTATEAAAIKAKLQKYADSVPRVHTDQEALTGVFQAARHPKVLILSTHGYFLPDQEIDPKESDRLSRLDSTARGLRLENPLLRCGLLLAGCNHADQAKAGEDNGVLTGLQIVGTDLRGCELVVLSACETGLGDVRNGEGVAGLRQAFQLAGAESVMATLWQVPDTQSAQLMIGFFDNLAVKQNKAEALRNAQLSLIKARRDKTAAAHPYFWAAFTVTGR